MTEWGVFLALGVIVSFLAGVITPITKLTKSITELTVALRQVTKDVEELKTATNDQHNELHAHNEQQDAKIQDHETRLRLMERK